MGIRAKYITAATEYINKLLVELYGCYIFLLIRLLPIIVTVFCSDLHSIALQASSFMNSCQVVFAILGIF